MERNYDLIDVLSYINPAELTYQEWVNVGMALKEAGYSAADWDSWSRADHRYRRNECFTKWNTFHGSATPVTAGTLVQMARENGWRPPMPEYEDRGELDWGDTIGRKDDLVVVDSTWVEGKEIIEPQNWNPAEELTTYLELLFDSSDYVGYVTETWERDGRHMPKKGNYDRTAGELIQGLRNCKGDIGAVIGDYKEEAGAWIRFNPVDGKGVTNDNVTEFRFALVESDAEDIEKQNAILRELELPIVTLVHSGKKSLHAIVRVDAADYAEYRKRVEYLYEVCKKNGLKVDTQNKNPSRLSRMPGVVRNGHKQFLVATNIGKESWKEWKDWIESVNDELPEYESLATEWDALPELAPPLIEGILRQGHKMLLAGPSKAGKSFALIELCVAIAEGRRWLGWQCTQGKVLYVNLELDRASCLHRFRDVYEAIRIKANNLQNIDLWNLRGHSVPMDRLAPKLIRRAAKKGYLAVVIDPIYKVITGDENSADQMANFCNQFDKVCTELGCAVIYCHHHSKGAQGGKKSMDRASGSGVFARDPDALLDLTELELDEKVLLAEQNRARCDVYAAYLDEHVKDFDPSQDELCSSAQLAKTANKLLTGTQMRELGKLIDAADRAVEARTAWRIEGTLREFPKFGAVNLWFDYPVHRPDAIGCLSDIQVEKPSVQRAQQARRKSAEEKRTENRDKLELGISLCGGMGEAKLHQLYEYFNGVASERTVRNWIKKYGYDIDKNTGCIVAGVENDVG